MPYLTDQRKKLLSEDPLQATEPGDWNYLYTQAYLHVFAREPKYETIYRLNTFPFEYPEVVDVATTLHNNGVSAIERHGAMEVAYDEFYRRVGGIYEDECIARNGDLKEYDKVLDIIDEKFRDKEGNQK